MSVRGLHIFHNSFQHGEKACNLGVKKLLNNLFKIFGEGTPRLVDYEKLTSSSKTDYPLRFCSHIWLENDTVATKPQVIWLKILEVLDSGRHLQNQVSLGERKKGKTKAMAH